MDQTPTVLKNPPEAPGAPRTAMFDPSPNLPAWLWRVAPRPASMDLVQLHDCGVTCRVGMQASPSAAVISAHLPGACSLAAAQFRTAVCELLMLMRERLAATPFAWPVRFWNFIPMIHEPVGSGLDRYRLFNLARYDAFGSWFGSPAVFARDLPTATGVGHHGHDLWIHALAAAKRGVPIENPRQIPAFRYSTEYGPRPPCFARATMVDIGDRELLLVGGTASVLGERSLHAGDLEAQTSETIENLRALLAHAPANRFHGLDRVTDARVYHVRSGDRDRLRAALAAVLPATAELEFVVADICREDLLVEIEAAVGLDPRSA